MSAPSPEQPQNFGQNDQPQNFAQPAQNQNFQAQNAHPQQVNPYGVQPAGQGFANFDRRPHVGFGQALKNNFKYLFHFSGRASRSEFWWAYAFWAVVGLVLAGILFGLMAGIIAQTPAVDNTTMQTYSDSNEAISAYQDAHMGQIIAILIGLALVSLLTWLATLAVSWRRLQDAGFHGAFWLLSLIGLSIVPFVMYFFPSSPNGLKYDKPQDKNRP